MIVRCINCKYCYGIHPNMNNRVRWNNYCSSKKIVVGDTRNIRTCKYYEMGISTKRFECYDMSLYSPM